jgi:sec-independent protein translocase protein TatA
MFGSLGVPELLLIFVVILIVFGPRRIPEIGRMLGKALGEFRKATDDIKNTIEREVRLEELQKIAPAAIAPFESVSRSEPVTPFPSPATPDVAFPEADEAVGEAPLDALPEIPVETPVDVPAEGTVEAEPAAAKAD